MITNLDQRAMLVNLSMSMWSARKHDKSVDQTVESHYNATNAGRFNKLLIAREAIKAVEKTSNTARTYHYANTLPWSDEGYRMLPVANFEKYSEEMRKHRATFDSAVNDFCANYDALVADAKVRLNGLFKATDYPINIRSRFSWGIQITPIPMGDDFRVNMSNTELVAIQNDIEHRTENAMKDAHADLYRRLIESVGHMADKLATKDAIFRDSLVDNLSELCELLPRLNVVDDAQLEAMRRKVEQKLCQHSPEALRNNEPLRQQTANDASAILKALEGMYQC
jgi:hypothetical protein